MSRRALVEAVAATVHQQLSPLKTPLSISGQNILDSTGATVRLFGCSDSQMYAGDGTQGPGNPDAAGKTWYIPASSEMSLLASVGFNVVRISLAWANIEPSAPTFSGSTWTHSWNSTYLSAVDQAVTYAEAAGLKVILSMQQSYWSPAYKYLFTSPTILTEGSGLAPWLYPQANQYSSTGTGVTYTANSLTDSSASWTANQWVASNLLTVGTPHGQGFITANSANTITVGAGWNAATPSAGDPYILGEQYYQGRANFYNNVAESGAPAILPQTAAVAVLTMLASRYNGNSAVIGLDIFNEPNPPGGAWILTPTMAAALSTFQTNAVAAVNAVNSEIICICQDNDQQHIFNSLTLYLTNTADGVLTTANQLTTVQPSGAPSIGLTIGETTGWVELTAQGISAGIVPLTLYLGNTAATDLTTATNLLSAAPSSPTSCATTLGSGTGWAELLSLGGIVNPVTNLTLYTTLTASTTLTTANELTNSAPSSSNSTTTTIGTTSTGWAELLSRGGSSTPAGSEPSPSGYGYLWDVTTLEGTELEAGNFTPTVRLRTSAGTMSAFIHVRAYSRTSAGVYNLLGESVTSSAQSLTSSYAVYPLPAIANASTAQWNTGDKLYMDVVLDITVNGLSGSGQILMLANGGVDEELITPGYQVPVSAEPSPSGYGFLWDVTTMEGEALQLGSYTPSLKLRTNSGSITADLHFRVYKRSSAGVYTPIVDAIDSAQTITSSYTTYSMPAANSSSSVSFSTGDKIYADLLVNINANSTGAGGQILVDLNGGSPESIATPGYFAYVGTEPAPSGYGWVFDSSLLDTLQFFASSAPGALPWTPSFKLKSSPSGSVTADVHFRVFKRSSGGSYTLLAESVDSAVTLPAGTYESLTLPTVNQASPSVVFNPGDRVYVDVLLNISANTLPYTGQINYVDSGGGAEEIVTPGYGQFVAGTSGSLPSGVVYSVHYYPSTYSAGQANFQMAEARAERFNVPMFWGEFDFFDYGRWGSSDYPGDWSTEGANFLNDCASNGASWAWWAYNGDETLIIPNSNTLRTDIAAVLEALIGPS